MRLRLPTLIVVTLAAAALAPAASATSYREDLSFGGTGAGPGQLSFPAGIAIDPGDGELFVADTGNNRVQVFSPTGTFARQFGSLGTAVGQFAGPLAVGVSPTAPFDVYVADSGNNRVQRFTNDGTFVSQFGTGQVQGPRAIAFDHSGNVYVGTNQAVSRFTADGTFQSVIGGSLATFQQLGGLAGSPAGTSFDFLFGTDTQADEARSFSLDGTSGTPYEPGALSGPLGIGVRATGTQATIFVADRGNHRVAVFAGGGPLVNSFGNLPSVSAVAWSDTAQRAYVVDGDTITTWQEVPEPVLGKSMDIQVDTGTVLFKPPGSKRFKRLKKVTLVKNGTVIDARRGTVSITSITAKGTLQSADFFKGVFKVIQKRAGKGLTEARLVGGKFKSCAKGARATKKAKPVRQLWAEGKGQFRTKGRYLSAAIRGTAWQTIDTCSGSTVKVTEGSVTVRDFLLKKTVTVNAGGFYSVTAPHAG